MAPVVIAGGPKMDSDEKLLQMVQRLHRRRRQGRVDRPEHLPAPQRHRHHQGHQRHRARGHGSRGSHEAAEVIPDVRKGQDRLGAGATTSLTTRSGRRWSSTGAGGRVVDDRDHGRRTRSCSAWAGSRPSSVERQTTCSSTRRRIGAMVTIDHPEDLAKASALKDKVEFVLIAANDWKVIPLENLIAEFQGSKTKVLAGCQRLRKRPSCSSRPWRSGVDGIVIETERCLDASRTSRSLPQVESARRHRAHRGQGHPDRAAQRRGPGLRGHLLAAAGSGEGMLVGSQSALPVPDPVGEHGERVCGRPAVPRQRRGGARLRAQLRRQDQIPLRGEGRRRGDGRRHRGQQPPGRGRPVQGRGAAPAPVGGRRPRAGSYTTILQNAETIRLCTPTGPVSVSDLKLGQEVLVRLEAGRKAFRPRHQRDDHGE